LIEIIDDTPIEKYKIYGHEVFVKREDGCVQPPGPPFSKVRGVLKHLETLKNHGIKTVGYVETSVSMAGWAVSWIAKEIGLRAVIFDPIYKHKYPKLLDFHRAKWLDNGAETIPIKAGMAKVNFYVAARQLHEKYKDAHMLELGLPLEETIRATSRISRIYNKEYTTVVVNVGSGTICAGLLKGMSKPMIFGIMGRTGSIYKKTKSIKEKSGIQFGGLLGRYLNLTVHDSGYEYTEPARIHSPFPSHPYYDLKAWEWLCNNIQYLDKPILFWNIGRMA